MPEEINRLVTDALADMLFTPSEDADENLLREGVPAEKIKLVGNIMIDTLVVNIERARRLKAYEKFGVKERSYALVTLHRPSNVDNETALSFIMESLIRLSGELPTIFSVHPRTKKQLVSFGLWERVNSLPALKISEPLSYHDSIGLIDRARFVLTDSGGIQEETTFMGIPCLTLRPNTERPITVTHGTNKLTSLETLEDDLKNVLNGHYKRGSVPELWDGLTGERIIKVLTDEAPSQVARFEHIS
jgi:UDP-N-acetylglucosamine 2-epimerase (non-hydrolysing)